MVFAIVLPERRIYLDDRAERYAVVDDDDYQYFVRWRWAPKFSKGRLRKCYAYRTKTERSQGSKRTSSLYLHVEILKRSGVARPSAYHIIGDHRDGDSLNCRKANLRWATSSQNRRNRFGAFPHDFADDIPIEAIGHDGRIDISRDGSCPF
jgi:hypothetical protein